MKSWGWAPGDEISVPERRDTRKLTLSPPTQPHLGKAMQRHSKKAAICKPGRGSPQNLTMLAPLSQTSSLQNYGKISVYWLSRPVYGILLWQPGWLRKKGKSTATLLIPAIKFSSLRIQQLIQQDSTSNLKHVILRCYHCWTFKRITHVCLFSFVCLDMMAPESQHLLCFIHLCKNPLLSYGIWAQSNSNYKDCIIVSLNILVSHSYYTKRM